MGKHVIVATLFLAAALLPVAVSARATPVPPAGAPEAQIPWDEIPPSHRDLVREVVARATVSARGPRESFPCKHEHYFWFLDHPDRAVVAWQRLGAKCVPILPRGEGIFAWTDEYGSEVTWETVCRGPDRRVWLAEGRVKPGPLLPAVPVKVVVVLNHAKGQSGTTTFINHRADVYLQTDSKSVNLVAKMFGSSSHKLAETGLSQLQLFFSGLSWYLNRYPERAEALLRD